jgi:hypothetical protein
MSFYRGADDGMTFTSPADLEQAYSLAFNFLKNVRDGSDDAVRLDIIFDAIDQYEADHGLDEGVIWGTA